MRTIILALIFFIPSLVFAGYLDGDYSSDTSSSTYTYGKYNSASGYRKAHRLKVKRRTFKELNLTLNDSNSDYKCKFRSSLFKKEKFDDDELLDLLRNMSFSTDCLTSEMVWQIENEKDTKKINGFAFGVTGGASITVGLSGGVEIVLIAKDRETLMVGMVNYGGITLELALPVGASITNSILSGKCNTIYDYLGNFNTATVIGLSKNYGNDGKFLFFGKNTGCNSTTYTLGASTAIAGGSTTRYAQATSFVNIKGERVQGLINYILD